MMVKIFGCQIFLHKSFILLRYFSLSLKEQTVKISNKFSSKISLNDAIFIKFTHVLDVTAKSPHSCCRHGRDGERRQNDGSRK